MKLAVMQPYFLPYLGYFDLLNKVDEWIVFDTPQYMKYGWVNRNRVLRLGTGWQYIMAPVKNHQAYRPINEIVLSDQDWTGLILRQLEHYKKDAPHYREVVAFLLDSFSGLSCRLSEVNTTLFRRFAAWMGIDRPIHVLSEMGLMIPDSIRHPSDWGWAVAQAVGATEFINRPGGAEFIKEKDYLERGIRLTFQVYETMRYKCGWLHQFEPDMSIVDVMMWNSREEIMVHLSRQRQPETLSGGTPCVG
jgi:hypothetical protein